MDKRVALGITAVFAVALLIGVTIIGTLVQKDLDRDDDGKDDTGSWTGEGLDERNATSEGVSDVSRALNQFGIDLYLELRNGSENVFISPYSIFTALSMTYEGAGGDTAMQMADVLYLPDNDTVRRGSFARVQNQIKNSTGDFELSSANKIWPQEGGHFLQSFYDAIEDFYYGGIEELDYSDPEAARQIINNWVKNQTNDRIKDLLPEGSIDGRTIMVLTNAIYFLGKWLYQFNAEETKDADFQLTSGAKVKVPTMGMKVEDGLNYYEDDRLQVVELPYTGGELSMMVLLPSGPISDIESSLSASYFNGIQEKMEEAGEVDVYLPKFEITTPSIGLKKDLKNLGMIEAFTPGADFSRMTDYDAWIDDVYHKAYVRVDEEGTEAAAATAVVMVNRTMDGEGAVVFRADHPFMFFIVHKVTNSILFMGKVEDPTL